MRYYSKYNWLLSYMLRQIVILLKTVSQISQINFYFISMLVYNLELLSIFTIFIYVYYIETVITLYCLAKPLITYTYEKCSVLESGCIMCRKST